MPRDGTTLALFIDGANTHATAKALGFDIDYKRLLTEFQSHGTLVRAFYYTVAPRKASCAEDRGNLRTASGGAHAARYSICTAPTKY